MSDRKLNIGRRISLELLWFAARLFSMMPYWFKFYIVEDFIYFLFRYVVRYRSAIVNKNLRNSFPDKSDREIAAIRNGFYRNLADVIVCTVNMAHMTEKKARRYLLIDDPEKYRRQFGGQDWVAMSGHFGCWEYASYWGAYDPTTVLLAVYHPLSSAVMEEFYRRLRTFEYSQPVPMQESLRFYLHHRGEGIKGRRLIMGLVADQNPRKYADSHWFRFLNQDTIFFDGGEKLALRCKLPVYFTKMKRMARGRYEMSFEKIYDGTEEVAPNTITERYVRGLEKMICECPEQWVWSHRRWKFKKPNVNS